MNKSSDSATNYVRDEHTVRLGFDLDNFKSLVLVL